MDKYYAEPSEIASFSPEDRLRRKEGLLHVACSCFYLQDHGLVLSIGQPYQDVSLYHSVLTKDEVLGEVVLGYMAQGRVRRPPDPNKCKGSEFLSADHKASCVHTSWIYAHMILKPLPSFHSFDSADFMEAVKLVRLAAATMCRVSFEIGRKALDLAEELKITDSVMASDALAEAALVQEDPLQEGVLYLPFDFLQIDPKYKVKPEDKNAARVAFETIVLEIFSFHVCLAKPRWRSIDDVMISTTGMHKLFKDTTPEERLSSGSVVLKHIKKDLKAGRHEAAILASLTASRGLERIARKLQSACDQCCSE